MDQIKKEPEPAPEAVKTEEKETVKNAQQSAAAKGPPEKRMRLQWRAKSMHVWISQYLENSRFQLPFFISTLFNRDCDISGIQVPVTVFSVEICYKNVNSRMWAALSKMLSVFILFWILASGNGFYRDVFCSLLKSTNPCIPYVLVCYVNKQFKKQNNNNKQFTLCLN